MFPLLFVSSGNRRKQCQQPCPTHQLLKPFEFSYTVSPASYLYPSSLADSSSHFPIDTYICGLRHLRYNLSHFEGRDDYPYSPIFRPTNNIRLYFLAAISCYLKVRCYEQARVIFPRLLTVPDPQFFFLLSHICRDDAGFVRVLLTSP